MSSSAPFTVREPLEGSHNDWLGPAIAAALKRIDKALSDHGDAFPAPSSENGVYATMDNTEWTNGFWTGQLWLAYELSGAEKYRQVAETHVDSFHHRIFNRINTDHHDLGFLYSLSCVAAFKLTGSPKAREAAIEAAKVLMTRFLPQAGIIQAWGNLDDPAEAGRMIIDCNLNLPLLYWASFETGDKRLRDAATQHIAQAQTWIVRPDASTFHTFYMDTMTGAPRHGSTHQGHSDDSCWARGQAWGISGFPLVYRYHPDASLIATSVRLATWFLERLPEDMVCCWDLIFTGEPHPRDSSAAAIAACGLLELSKSLPLTDPERTACEAAALAITESLARHYASTPEAPGNGLLEHGVYHMPKGIGVDEYCLWGDYFYLEALTRLTRVWEPYW